MRVRPAPRDLRLRGRQRVAAGSRRGMGRPPARALPKPGDRPERPLRRPHGAGLQRRDASRIARALRVPERARLGRAGRARRRASLTGTRV